MNIKKSAIFVKSMVITTVIFLITFFAFIAMNESQRLLDGEAVSIYLTADSFSIVKGRHGYRVEPDVGLIRSFVNYVFKHPAIIPFPFQFIVHSKDIVEDFGFGDVGGFDIVK